MKVSFHNHSTYSDGQNTLAEMAEFAYNSGFTHFAFTDHLYIPGENWTLQPDEFDEYINSIDELKDKYRNKMHIISGAEADWSVGGALAGKYYDEISQKVDITIGSVHVLKGNGNYYCIDSDEEFYAKGIEVNFSGSAKDMFKEYFMLENEVVSVLKPNLVAHPDIIRLNNYMDKYFSTNSVLYESLCEELAKNMKKHGSVTELNGGGAYRRGWDVYYPGNRLLNILRELGVPITIGLDAHNTDMIDAYYDISMKMILNAGYKSIAVFENGIWNEASINEFM